MSAGLEVLAPGAATTIQDLGRPGLQRFGVAVGGALDAWSLRVANLLAGNPASTGALEMLYRGPRLRIAAPSARVAFFGARARPTLWRAGLPIPLATGRSHLLRADDEIDVGALSGAATLYAAFEGGFDIAPVLGGVSTYLRGGLGGWDGRALRAGDALPLAYERVGAREEAAFDVEAVAPTTTLRFVDGPQADHFSAAEFAAFQDADYLVGAGADRQGARLRGRALACRGGHDIVSDGLRPGSIQIPGDGQPIAMRCEHQTTGGYPKIGTVISADGPALGRLGPGDRVRFQRVTIEEAEAAGAAYRRAVATLSERVRRQAESWDEAPLAAVNLISGVCDARHGFD